MSIAQEEKPFENHFEGSAMDYLPKSNGIERKEYHKLLESRKWLKVKSEAQRTQNISGGNWHYDGPTSVPTSHAASSVGTGRISDVKANPNNLHEFYTASNGALWYKQGDGYPYENITDHDPKFTAVTFTTLEVDWANGFIYCGAELNGIDGSLGFFKSEDGGNTWNQINTGLFPPGQEDVVFDDPLTTTVNERWQYYPSGIKVSPDNSSILFASTWNFLFKSTNGGISWEKLIDLKAQFSGWNYFNNVDINPNDGNDIVTGGSLNILYQNGAVDKNVFTNITPQTSENIFPGAAAFSKIDNSVWMGYTLSLSNSGSGDLYVTKHNYNNNSVKTKKLKSSVFTNWFMCVASSKTDRDVAYVGTGQAIRKADFKDNNPANWTSFSIRSGGYPSPGWIHDDIRIIDVHEATSSFEDVLFVAHDGGLSKSIKVPANSNENPEYELISEDDGGLFTYKIWGLGGTESSEGRLIAGFHDMGIFNRDKSFNWVHHRRGDGGDGLIDRVDEDVSYASIIYGSGALYKNNRNNGISYSSMSSGSVTYTPIVQHPGPNGELYQCSGSKGVKVYANPRTSNSYTEIPFLSSFYISAFEISSKNTDRMYAGGYDNFKNRRTPGFWRTDDGGNSWTDISFGLNGYVSGYASDIKINPSNDNELWVSFGRRSGNNKFYHSINGGSSWELMNIGLPENLEISKMAADFEDNMIYAASSSGVLRFDINNSTWYAFSDCLPIEELKDIEIHKASNQIRVATFGRGLWASNLYFCSDENYPIFTGEASSTNYYGKYTITSTQIFENNVVARMKAGEFIDFEPGLEIKVGTDVTVMVDRPLSCTNCSNGYKIPSARDRIVGLNALEDKATAENTTKSIPNLEFQSDKISIFPNPVQSEPVDVFIDKELSGPFHVYVYSMAGIELLSEVFNTNRGELKTATLLKGSYVVKVISGEYAYETILIKN